MNTNPFHRRLAKFLLWQSNVLNFIKTPSRTYEWTGDPFNEFKFAGWTMLPALSISLMGASYRLDPIHWDHWSVEYDEDERKRLPHCAVCEGYFPDDDL